MHEPVSGDAAAQDPDGIGLAGGGEGRRLLVVSHPAVVGVNQEIYRELHRRGWELTLVVPSRWRHSYADDVVPQALPGLEQALHPLPVTLRGRPQRHVYLASTGGQARRARPDVAFLEEEPYALAAMQWAVALARRGIPFGVQCYENIDRPLPAPVAWGRGRLLRAAAFVAARSQTAGELARRWGARGEVGFAPPAVPGWQEVPAKGARPFTIGYAGRLVESKGLLDLLAAARAQTGPVQLVFIGDGELRTQLDGAPVGDGRARVVTGVGHDAMAAQYAELDVLALPSHTTSTWKEQFGRVIVEALWCGVPVVGSDSGEIPWLIELTGGGLVFPEGDSEALAERLARLNADRDLRERLAATGRAAVERLFTVPAATDSLERLLLAAGPARKAG